MTSNLLENVQVYLLSQAVTRYCKIYFGISLKMEYISRINNIIKKSEVENLKNLFLFHGLLYYLSEKKNSNRGSPK